MLIVNLDHILWLVCLWMFGGWVLRFLLWLFVKLIAEASWAPWNGPEYEDCLRIEPQKRKVR